ncbi:MAG: M67 family metallopeptidase [Tannerella sp.]|jgi:proteasome lid subunit RPN8/RPN11|nr:M67 family metallopeptidase [Tannerella sp.]
MKTIRIPQHIIAAIFEHAQDELPNEACGLLTGSGDTALQQHALTNIDHSPVHFALDPREQFCVLKIARADSRRILASYHSHPASPARPSDEDIRLALDPDIIYIIVSLMNPEPDIKAFSIVRGTVEEAKIEIIKS